MNKRRRFIAKRRRRNASLERAQRVADRDAELAGLFRRSTFPAWRAGVASSGRPLTLDIFKRGCDVAERGLSGRDFDDRYRRAAQNLDRLWLQILTHDARPNA